MAERRYRVGEVSTLSGVSVRTLHHYDQIGLVRPSARSESGYRLYEECDLLRLQQVLTLRYLGLSLAEIGTLIDQPGYNIALALQIQRDVLLEQAGSITRLVETLEQLIERHDASGEWAWDLVSQASSAVQDRLTKGETVTMSADERQRRFAELGASIPPADIRSLEDDWSALMTEVRANRDLDPASDAARALADRWQAQSARTAKMYESDPKLWADIGEGLRENRHTHPMAPTPEDFAFIQRVTDAR